MGRQPLVQLGHRVRPLGGTLRGEHLPANDSPLAGVVMDQPRPGIRQGQPKTVGSGSTGRVVLISHPSRSRVDIPLG